jgi:hypothetical protein
MNQENNIENKINIRGAEGDKSQDIAQDEEIKE